MPLRRLPRSALAVALILLLPAGAQAGGALRRATGSVGAPAWSPGGGSIAWTELVPDAGRRIWVASRNDSAAHPVTRPIDALGAIAWLPGRRLVYEANFRLSEVDLGSGRSTLLSRTAGDSFAVDRRGDRIATGAASCQVGCSGSVLVLDTRGRIVRRLGGARMQNLSPSFSPAGARVAFDRVLCGRDGRCERRIGIWTASVASGALRRVTASGVCAAWSPSGGSIAYVDGAPPGRLRVVASGGGAPRTLVRSIGGCNVGFTPAWSPDSRSVAAVDLTSGALVVVDARTGRERRATTRAVGAVTGFAWSRDSSQLLVVGQESHEPCAALWLVTVKTAAARRLRSCG